MFDAVQSMLSKVITAIKTFIKQLLDKYDKW